ncbi:MAG: hypothetical protein DWB42_00355 [Chloroflexi bacterium]|nr:hypothetical protein [Chloroflexota bacterium]MDL1883915.1 hypothetical protein [Anaerolineae bacterium CFX8]
MDTQNNLRAQRDRKAKPHLEQFAPVWILDEKIMLEEEAIVFDVAFQHPQYGWVSRRYRYDLFNDVLYYRGQVVLDEEEAIEIQSKEPYIAAAVANIPNAYGG